MKRFVYKLAKWLGASGVLLYRLSPSLYSIDMGKLALKGFAEGLKKEVIKD